MEIKLKKGIGCKGGMAEEFITPSPLRNPLPRICTKEGQAIMAALKEVQWRKASGMYPRKSFDELVDEL